jgi:hypothetical protein
MRLLAFSGLFVAKKEPPAADSGGGFAERFEREGE